ncbi:MAG: hypothetical protein ABJD11_18980, partial [Gemmatimonadota bacterium]
MEAMPGLNRTVRFSPEGLLFNPAHLPSLKLDTKGCALPKKGSEAKVAYVNETLHILNLLPSVIDSLAGTTDAHLKHFSRYAVAW